jgi:hypothetical protein
MDFMDVHFRIRQAIVRDRDRGRIPGKFLVIHPARERLRKVGSAKTIGKALAVAEKISPDKAWVITVPPRDEYDVKRDSIEDRIPPHPSGCVKMGEPSRFSFSL